MTTDSVTDLDREERRSAERYVTETQRHPLHCHCLECVRAEVDPEERP